MFYFSATEQLVAVKTIQIFNYGNCKRDFTYIDDIVEGVYRVMQDNPEKANGEEGLPLAAYKCTFTLSPLLFSNNLMCQ